MLATRAAQQHSSPYLDLRIHPFGLEHRHSPSRAFRPGARTLAAEGIVKRDELCEARNCRP
jgi:hypothetical protein